jgi:hypothetical protein
MRALSALILSFVVLSFVVIYVAKAGDFARLDPAIPGTFVADLAPVFDFDSDGCLPSAGISRNGEQNGGQKPTGSIGGACRSANFLDTSNTLHRFACTMQGGSTYCGHFYALYFEKDQITSAPNPFNGHRHDWEYAAIWTKDGVMTHGTVSTHHSVETRVVAEIPFENNLMKVVYHKDEGTHALRFAKPDERAENPYGRFVTPTVVSWFHLTGDGLDNATMRAKLNSFDYGAANLPVSDKHFLVKLNATRPFGYPEFSPESTQRVESIHRVTYRAHVASFGWLPWGFENETAGTTGQSRQMEAFEVRLINPPAGMQIRYRAHVADKGWLDWVYNGATAGTVGESRRAEAFQIELVNAPVGMRVEYHAHVAGIGWLPWVANGQVAGTTGQGRQVEAIEIRIVP